MVRLTESIMALRPLVVLVGPTAVGKSEIGLRLARGLDTELLTADSRQVYRGMDIATDKPAMEQRQGVPHRLIDLVDPDEPFNAGQYRTLALQEIERLYGERRVPLIVGGTGLYVRTLIHGLCDAPRADQAFRAALLREAEARGRYFLHEELTRVDPESAARLHPHDEVKLVRALEVYHLSGRRLSEMQQRHGFAEQPFSVLMIGLHRDRPQLYRRIDARVEVMFERGVVEETANLLAQGYQRELGAMKGLGYQQVAGYLSGEYDRAEALRLLQRDTRHFAKRQLTWFRKEPGLQWRSLSEQDSPEDVAGRLLETVQSFLRDLSYRRSVEMPASLTMETGSTS
ncbi:tRNA dimethylallyltransferase [Nitrospira defluvii]|mgnify:CR=1 FL=1|uniref:tRNA dimethylallyltransferase n=2 Tax=Nitrospira defluvii TaxID=330214 RepID=A0ABM8REA0_9BACT|nr:tRNA dimethylallyltransferase [Nitrospira defluvii]